LVTSVERRNAFIKLMKECFEDIVEEQFGKRPGWDAPVMARGSERSGNA
jgi:hypothetical protein